MAAVVAKDYPMIQGSCSSTRVMVLAVNLVVDLILVTLDPEYVDSGGLDG